MKKTSSILLLSILLVGLMAFFSSCDSSSSKSSDVTEKVTTTPADLKADYPSDVIPFFDQFKILLGNGESSDDLVGFEHKDFIYTAHDGADWVVYKTPNSGTTSPNSSNTRTELHQKEYWTPKKGGKLTGTLKVQHVSTSGDARVAASYSVVVGQIHGSEGHENEPLKIYYKKFPGQEKGSVFWNYEINTAGDDNSGRWENVFEGIMYLSFKSEGHATKTFTKNLIASEYTTVADIPQQIQDLFVPIGQDGVERPEAYAGELNYFKQGAYNQTNGKDPSKNMVWCTGAEVYGGDIAKQYANGSYAEVWFKEATVGPSTSPKFQ